MKECDHKGKYLGLPFHDIVDKLASKLGGWKMRNLPQAGSACLLCLHHNLCHLILCKPSYHCKEYVIKWISWCMISCGGIMMITRDICILKLGPPFVL